MPLGVSNEPFIK